MSEQKASWVRYGGVTIDKLMSMPMGRGLM
jgi:hypothetical protein